MKIITWNCNGAFRRKFEYLTSFNADLLVIQECENPSETNHKQFTEWAENFLWIGDNKNKGLAVFAKPEIKLTKLNWSSNYENHNVKYFLPCSVNNKFDLLAVWTHRNNSPNFGYIGQFWKYLQINRHNILNTFIVGDLNSNSNWDEWDRWWNHSDVVSILNERGLESYYHKITGEAQGKESKPTLFFQKNIDKKYHIDYIFGPTEFIKRIKKYEIGKVEKWLHLSDHMPIFCELE
ncbi:MAG: hypothetical protein PHI36_09275 [Bacteroidales bacterium]|nr:hypothetical protein [Bacteroidales bacterium]